jgi:lactoylglutathione lyase
VIAIEGLFETHITVSDLQRSIVFYRDVVGLELGIVQPERPAAFFWVGGHGRSMLGIFSLGSCPLTMRHPPRPELGLVSWSEWQAIQK